MATTSIWKVRGWLGKVVLYAQNPDKTDNPAFVESVHKSEEELQSLSDVIEYAINAEKTDNPQLDDEAEQVLHRFVSGVNCLPATARQEMMAVKKRFGKDDGIVAFHGYQSFAPGEATPELAHKIGVELAQRLWGERFQVIIATHLDRANHMHNHFVVNSVSFADGKRYYRSKKDYWNMRSESDRLCRENGLSVIQSPQRGQTKHYSEWLAASKGEPTLRSIIKADVDAAIQEAVTDKEFFNILRSKYGYSIKFGKDISSHQRQGKHGGYAQGGRSP